MIAVIPARGGSKGIHRKNLTLLSGEPLIVWSIKSALASGVIDRVIVSTDSEEIAKVAKTAGAEVPFMRPSELAFDEVHAIHVILHMLEWLGMHEQETPEGVMMLLPTSPLRRASDIRGAVDLFRRHHAPAVVSVVDLGKYMTNLRYLQGECLERVAPEENPHAQRQGLDKLYSVNGSIFLARPDVLQTAGTFHITGAMGFVMGPIQSIDINTPEDLELAKLMVSALNLTSEQMERTNNGAT